MLFVKKGMNLALIALLASMHYHNLRDGEVATAVYRVD